VGALDRLDQRVEVRGHLVVGHRRCLGEIARLVVALGGPAQGTHGERRAIAVVDRVAAGRPDDRPGLGERVGVLEPVPHDRLHRARAVPERQLQERLAVAPLAAEALAHDEDRLDVLAVDEVAHEVPGAGEGGLLHRSRDGRSESGRDRVHVNAVGRRCARLT
jgi:hypothetical protein